MRNIRLHLTADSLHKSLQLRESVGSLQSELTLRKIVVCLVLQQLQSFPDVKVGLLESSSGMRNQFDKAGDDGTSRLSHLKSSVETWPASHFLLAAWRIGMCSSK